MKNLNVCVMDMCESEQEPAKSSEKTLYGTQTHTGKFPQAAYIAQCQTALQRTSLRESGCEAFVLSFKKDWIVRGMKWKTYLGDTGWRTG